jgi:hypothetical protein
MLTARYVAKVIINKRRKYLVNWLILSVKHKGELTDFNPLSRLSITYTLERRLFFIVYNISFLDNMHLQIHLMLYMLIKCDTHFTTYKNKKRNI